jgi:hypothetical protein
VTDLEYERAKHVIELCHRVGKARQAELFRCTDLLCAMAIEHPDHAAAKVLLAAAKLLLSEGALPDRTAILAEIERLSA